MAEQKEVLKQVKRKQRSQNEALREQFTLKKQKLTEAKKAEKGEADTKVQKMKERFLALTDSYEQSRKTIMSENERVVNTLESEKAALQSQVSRLQEQLLRTKQKLRDRRAYHLLLLKENPKYRQYYLKVSEQTLSRVRLLLGKELKELAQRLRHKIVKNEEALVYLFVECLQRGDQPWVEIARYKTGPSIKQIFISVLEAFDKSVAPVYLYLQTFDEIKKQLGSLPVYRPNPKHSGQGVKVPKLAPDGTPLLGPEGEPVYRTLLDDLEQAINNPDALLLVDGMPLAAPLDASLVGRRLQYSTYKHSHIFQSLLVAGVNRRYQFRSPLHGGSSSENYDMWHTSRLEQLLTAWATESGAQSPGIIGDAAFAPRAAQLLSKGIHLHTTQSKRVEEVDPVLTAAEAEFVRSLQSLRAPIEHLVGALNGPTGWSIVQKPCRDTALLERIINACMTLANIETIVRTQERLRIEGQQAACPVWEPTPLETRQPWQTTVNVPAKIPRAWKPPVSRPLGPAVEQLLADMVGSGAFADLQASKLRYGVDTQHNLSEKTESRADQALLGGNLRYTEFGQFSGSPGYFLVGRCAGSAKDLTYFPTLYFADNHKLLRHSCTCFFSGRGEPIQARRLTERLAKMQEKLRTGHYLPQLDQAQLDSASLADLRFSCKNIGLLQGGRKGELVRRLVQPRFPDDYPRKAADALWPLDQLRTEVETLQVDIADLYASINLAATPWCTHQFALFKMLHLYCGRANNRNSSHHQPRHRCPVSSLSSAPGQEVALVLLQNYPAQAPTVLGCRP